MFLRVFVRRLLRNGLPSARRALMNPKNRSFWRAGAFVGATAVSTALVFPVFCWSKSQVNDPTDMDATDQNGELESVRKADLLYKAGFLDDAYDVLKDYVSSKNSEVQWRVARVLCELAKNTKNAVEKKRLLSVALDVMKTALCSYCKGESNGCFVTHKWYAIALGHVSQNEGLKEQVKNAPEVRTHLEKAIGLNPYDADVWHLLGLWHYSCAYMSGYMRWGANVILGQLPSSTYEEALRHFERAEALQSNISSANAYYLGRCMERLDRNREAQEYLEKSFIASVEERCSLMSRDDKEIHKWAGDHLCKKYGYTKTKLAELEATKSA